MKRTLSTKKKKMGLNIYFEDNERAWLDKRSDETDYSLSSYVRALVLQDMEHDYLAHETVDRTPSSIEVEA